MSSSCCLKGFPWSGTPTGRESKIKLNSLGKDIDTYIAGSDTEKAILIVADLLGWTFTNTRLLADCFAKEVGATVYIPDLYVDQLLGFFDKEIVPPSRLISPEDYATFDFRAWFARHSKEIRGPEIVEAARVLKRDNGFKKVGAVGYCYGGWGVFELGAKDKNLVDAISTAHPSFLTKEEISAVSVPMQILAPEHDPAFTPELKEFANREIPKAVGEEKYEYIPFPGLEHGFATRGDPNDEMQRAGLEKGMREVVRWMGKWLSME
ncbi:MAG: hypothetical protein Q9174_005049 [Haloplaca sp. 1 TL-2023]